MLDPIPHRPTVVQIASENYRLNDEHRTGIMAWPDNAAVLQSMTAKAKSTKDDNVKAQ